ncbi:MAG: hypothetical protein VB111_11820 [Clostridiaceae bacterium]|nr:hypothetical protein [Clostridiaceae bacterium]
MKRTLALFLALFTFSFSASSTAIDYVNDSIGVTRYSYIYQLNCSTDIPNDEVYARISPRPLSTNSAYVFVELLRFDGSTWVVEDTWEDSSGAGEAATVDGLYPFLSGRTYKVRATGYIYDSQGNLLEWDQIENSPSTKS